jgi:hypothetical protein
LDHDSIDHSVFQVGLEPLSRCRSALPLFVRST